MSESLDKIRYDEHGLVPAIVQDAVSGEVLMLAYMNEESLTKTLGTGHTHFWSRSRQELWHKGETSGHFQKVKRISLDCDGDALLVQVEQEGAACHTGNRSCFYTEAHKVPEATRPISDTLGSLMRVIHSRHTDMPEGSYTTTLFRDGLDRILKKVGEEAGEVIIAAKNQSVQELAWESADLLYHLLVLLEQQGMSMQDVCGELEKRVGGRKKQ